MSWDVDLIDDRGHTEGSWNYTHNVNGMIAAAMDAAGIERLTERTTHAGIRPVSWWKHIGGMSGPAGGAVIHAVIGQFEADPEWFRAMNPENGWGDFDSLVMVLREMRAAIPEWPTSWAVSG